MIARDPHPEDWKPNPGPQTRFLSLTCFEALYGGSSGGGKSDALLVDAIRYVGRGYGPNYQALLLRRTFPDLEKSLVQRSWALYPRIGGKYNQQAKAWHFPDGERILFGYLELEKDVYQYQGAAFPFVGFDELGQFSRPQYTYLISRIRSAHGVPLRLRASTNPGGPGHEFIFERWGLWLDPECMGAAPGEVAYLMRDTSGVEFRVRRGARHELADGKRTVVGSDGKAREVAADMLALGRTFVPAKLSDNPYLANDGAYARGLDELDPVTRAQLKDGNWLAKPGKGLYFRRAWFEFLDASPTLNILKRVRAYDLAASQDGDWTIGVRLLMLRDRTIVIEHVVRTRGTPQHVEDTIRQTADEDGKAVTIRLPQDPGQAGVSQVAALAKLLMGFRTVFERPTGDKITRAGPVSSYCERRLVKIVRGPWNAPFLDCLEAFPEGTHDDDVDAFADAFNYLSKGGGLVKLTGGGGERRDLEGFG